MRVKYSTGLKLLIGLSPALLLGACSYIPVQPTGYQQCMGLQRQILFSEDMKAGHNQWNAQTRRDRLQQEFNKLHCGRILQEARDRNSPQK